MSTEAPFKTASIARDPVSEQVVAHLLGMVRAGNLKAGDRLPSERELSQSFGVSRPTIREAVRALAVLGVLKTHHGGGIYVSNLQAEDLLGPLQFFLSLEETSVDALYDARQTIEGGIAARAAAVAREEDINALRELIERQKTVINDPPAWRTLDTEFHARIQALAGNPFLSRAANSLNILGLEFRTMASESSQVIAQSLLDHAAIVAALSANDSEAAEQAMCQHMLNVLHSTRKSMASAEQDHKHSPQGDTE